jgi:hypothetical protein
VLKSSLNDGSQLNYSSSQSQSHITTDGQSISKSQCRAPSGAHDQIFNTLWQLRSCFCGAPSLTRGRVCLLYMLLILASVVFLGSESLWTRDHILLSQIWDFPFRRLLRLAGSRWRYSTPPPHRYAKVKVTLRLAVYLQSICLGTNPLRLTTRIFFPNWALAMLVLT